MAWSHRQLFEAADPFRAPRVSSTANVEVDRATLFAGHAECPTCGAFVSRLRPLASRSIVGQLIAGYCSVCCTTSFFAPSA
jgi:hypothetical protein